MEGSLITRPHFKPQFFISFVHKAALIALILQFVHYFLLTEIVREVDRGCQSPLKIMLCINDLFTRDLIQWEETSTGKKLWRRCLDLRSIRKTFSLASVAILFFLLTDLGMWGRISRSSLFSYPFLLNFAKITWFYWGRGDSVNNRFWFIRVPSVNLYCI